MTAKYAIIGDPVEHSLSPALHNAAFAALGIDARFEAIRVTRDGLGVALARLRADYAGFNVTTPLKDAIYSQLDAVTDVAADIGAVNTVRVEKGATTGHNTDGTGFAAAILDVWRLAPRGKFACVLGSGPAARAIAQTLRRMGAARLTCWSRNPLTAEEIGPPPDARPDLLVSALPSDALVPEDVLEVVAGAAYVFDVNYRSARSPVPASIGVYRSDGLPLLLHQGVLAFEWWTGTKAPLDAMRTALSTAS